MPKIFVVNEREVQELENSHSSNSMSQSERKNVQSSEKNQRPNGKRAIKTNIDIQPTSNQSTFPGGHNFNNAFELESNEQDIHNIIRHVTLDEQRQEVSLESEKIQHEEKANKRQKLFKDILVNTKDDFSMTKLILYSCCVIIAGLTSTVVYAIIPAHDLVLRPEFWYEAVFHGAYMAALSWMSYSIVGGYILNLNFTKTIKSASLMFLSGFLAGFGLITAAYFFWTQVLLYQYPIPLFMFVKLLLAQICMPAFLWIRFPSKWRKNKIFQKRMKFFVLISLLVFPQEIAYQSIAMKIITTEGISQSIYALAMPTAREILLFLFEQLTRRASDGDVSGAMIIVKYEFSIYYILWLCFLLGPTTTDLTTWTLMGIDLITNFVQCLRLVWKKKRNSEFIISQQHLLEDLAVSELSECHGPLFLLITFAIAFYGPNAGLIAGISNDYWSNFSIDDIDVTLKTMILYFFVDFSSLIFCALILWVCCRINLFAALAEVQKEFGIGMSLILARLAANVSSSLIFTTLFERTLKIYLHTTLTISFHFHFLFSDIVWKFGLLGNGHDIKV